MSHWTRWRRHLIGDPPPNHMIDPPEETPMTPTSTVAEQITQLRDQIDGITTDAAADPAAIADDLTAWRRRETKRQDRVVELEQKVRQLGELGALVADEHAMGAIRVYTTATADARTKLGPVATRRSFGGLAGGARDVKAPALLRTWLAAMSKLATVLPAGDDTTRYLCDQYTRWYRARDGWLVAIANHEDGGLHVPSPELDGLPTGLAHGVHPVRGEQTRG